MKPVKLALAAALAAGLAPALSQPAAAADVPAEAARSCFRLNEIRGQKVADDKTLYFRVTGNDVYRVETASACLSGARFNDPVLLKAPSGSNQVCRAVDLDLAVLNLHGTKSPCIVDRIVKLTPEEVASLPPKHKP